MARTDDERRAGCVYARQAGSQAMEEERKNIAFFKFALVSHSEVFYYIEEKRRSELNRDNKPDTPTLRSSCWQTNNRAFAAVLVLT